MSTYTSNGNISNIIKASNIGTQQQPYNFYILDNLDNNFIFECTTLDIAYTLNTSPSFINYFDYSTLGFGNVSQNASLRVRAQDLNDLFVFTPNVNTIMFDQTQLDDMLYGVSAEIFKNFQYSQALVNSTTTVASDYIESLSYSITKGINLGSIIFKNIDQMLAGVNTLDSQFNFLLNQGIHNSSGLYEAQNNLYSLACKQLVAGILSVGPDNRKSQFITDIQKQTPPYKVIFHTNDTIAIRIGYIPKYNLLAGISSTNFNVSLTTRTYKIFMTVISE